MTTTVTQLACITIGLIARLILRDIHAWSVRVRMSWRGGLRREVETDNVIDLTRILDIPACRRRLK